MRRGHHLLLAGSAMACATAVGAGETVTYSYDSLGRVTRVSRSGTVNSGVTADYRYDAADNRTNVSIAVPGAAIPSVLGGSFEAPEMGSSYAYTPAGGPATFEGAAGIAGNGSAWLFEAAPDGDQIAFIQNGTAAAVISLPLSGLTPGASYRISFRIAGRPFYPPVPVTLAYNGSAIGTFTPQSSAFTTASSVPFTATASTGTLSITSIAASGDRGSGLDRVTIAPAGGQP